MPLVVGGLKVAPLPGSWVIQILNGLLDTLLRKLQSMQNATATGTRRRDRIMPVLCELHCLLIREHVSFKVACLVRQLLSG